MAQWRSVTCVHWHQTVFSQSVLLELHEYHGTNQERICSHYTMFETTLLYHW